MPSRSSLNRHTVTLIRHIYERLDYAALGPIYCDEGGAAFWKEKKKACEVLGSKLAEVLKERLARGGRSLYVGAGVAEIPLLAMESMELDREVAAYNLRADEVAVLNRACKTLRCRVLAEDAQTATGFFDHLCVVSALNDPERFPESSGMAYGRIHPVVFDTEGFLRERQEILVLVDACLRKLRLPALVTTSVEEIPWITDWCTRHDVACAVEEEDYPTALVEDPACFMRVGVETKSLPPAAAAGPG